MVDTEKLKQEYIRLFPAEMPISEISEKLAIMEQDDRTLFFRRTFCDELVYSISAGFIEYGTGANFKNDALVRIFVANAERLPKEDSFIQMLSAFYQGKQKACLSCFDKVCEELKQDIEGGADRYSEAILVDFFIEPMKEAFHGFWDHAQEKLVGLCKNDGTQELCRLMDQIHYRKTDEEAIDILSAYIQKYPDILVSK